MASVAELLLILFVFALIFLCGFALGVDTRSEEKHVQSPPQLNRTDVEAILAAARETTDEDLAAYVDQIMTMRPEKAGPRRDCTLLCGAPAVCRIIDKTRTTFFLCDLHYREAKELGHIKVEERL